MRGMVMEVKGSTLVVLTPQGKYLRIKNDGTAAIGDFVTCDSPAPVKIHWVPRNVMAFAASLMLICSAGLGAYGYSQPFGIVSIDINPSMSLTYNWFDQVIGVEALNPDGEKLLPDLGDLKHRQVPEAVQIVLNAASKAGYMKPELANVVFISVSDKSNKGRSTALLNAIEHDLANISDKTETVLLTGTPEIYNQVSHTHGSPIKELIDSSLSGKTENNPLAHSSKPLKDILSEQKEKRDKSLKPQMEENTAPVPESNGKSPGTDKDNQQPQPKPSKNPENTTNSNGNNNIDSPNKDNGNNKDNDQSHKPDTKKRPSQNPQTFKEYREQIDRKGEDD